MKWTEKTRGRVSQAAGIAVLLAGFLLGAALCYGAPTSSSQVPSIFKPESTPADTIFGLSLLFLVVTGLIFAGFSHAK